MLYQNCPVIKTVIKTVIKERIVIVENKNIKLSEIAVQPKDTSRGHFYVSLVKSALRIIAGYALTQSNFVLAGGLFIAAEVLGIVEELV